LAEIDAELLLEVWSLAKDYVPTKERQEVCEQMVQVFENFGFDTEHLSHIEGNDKYIDKILKDLEELTEKEDFEDYED
jgi:hypothetical protein